MNIVETWNKLQEVGDDKIKLFDEMDIFYEDNVYIIFKADYSKRIAPIICPYRKFYNLDFSTFKESPFTTTTNYYIISVWRNISNTEQFNINDLTVTNMKGGVMNLEQSLLATPIKYKKLPQKISKKITKEMI